MVYWNNLEEEAIKQSNRSEKELRKDLKFWENQVSDLRELVDQCNSGELRKQLQNQVKDAKEWIAMLKMALSFK